MLLVGGCLGLFVGLFGSEGSVELKVDASQFSRKKLLLEFWEKRILSWLVNSSALIPLEAMLFSLESGLPQRVMAQRE